VIHVSGEARNVIQKYVLQKGHWWTIEATASGTIRPRRPGPLDFDDQIFIPGGGTGLISLSQKFGPSDL
jgi:hypothetical protein